ncbi:hypothetical protein GCM10020229_41220 [Kitasatospora albolonga]
MTMYRNPSNGFLAFLAVVTAVLPAPGGGGARLRPDGGLNGRQNSTLMKAPISRKPTRA